MDFDAGLLDELILESKEHLDNIEPDLLALEREGGLKDPESINRIFRAVHSIKGGFSFFNMAHIKDLAHVMENVLSKVRDKDIEFSPELIDTLFAGMDKLRVLIDDVEHSDTVSIEAEGKRFEAILHNLRPTDHEIIESAFFVSEASQAILDQFSVDDEDMTAALRHGKMMYRIRINLRADLSAKNRAPMQFIKGLLEVGELVDTKIDLNLIDGLDDCLMNEISYSIIYATVLEFDLLADYFEIPEQQVEVLDIRLNPKFKPLLPGKDKEPKAEAEAKAPAPVAQPEPVAQAAPAPEPAAPEHPEPEPASDDADSTSRAASEKKQEVQTLRVKLNLLDKLMTLAGELVLGRNQIKQALNRKLIESCENDTRQHRFRFQMAEARENLLRAIRDRGQTDPKILRDLIDREFRALEDGFAHALDLKMIDIPGLGGMMQNMDLVTSELQSSIMDTRMQQVGHVFTKFPRIVRDIARKLDKQIDLKIEGEDVELDKSIIEALVDPLTHLIRNCADHGIEVPATREKNGKPATGLVELRAFHAGGKVIISIEDDGAGLNAQKLVKKAVERGLITPEAGKTLSQREIYQLIFLPGFSTAEQVSDISGRGVGMDVVRTNIERIGGSIDVDSTPGKGTTIQLKLPLTLAIIPSLIITLRDQLFAVPQVELVELVRIRAMDVAKRLENVKGKPVIRLREKLLPIIFLSDVLGLERTYVGTDGEQHTDRRVARIDRRAEDLSERDELAGIQDNGLNPRGGERRLALQNALNIVVLKSGNLSFGLVVDKLQDCEEIVVKPLPGYLKSIPWYAGTTIMGDGRVAMILDTNGLAQATELKATDLSQIESEEALRRQAAQQGENQFLLLFHNGNEEQFALNMALISRVEKINNQSIQRVGDKEFINLDDKSMRLLRLHDYMKVKPPAGDSESGFAIIPKLVSNPCAIYASRIDDIIETHNAVDRSTLTGKGIFGSMILGEHLTVLVDVYGLLESADPENNHSKPLDMPQGKRILLAEDTQFFRNIEENYLREFGFEVDSVTDGEQALEKLGVGHYDLLVTDIQMPRMTGIELASRIRQMDALASLPIIALTSLVNEADRKQIMASGVDAYETKLDKISLQHTIQRLLKLESITSGKKG